MSTIVGKNLSVAALAAAGVLAMAGMQSAHATTVATIVGGYDIGPGNEYDTPALEFTNSSGGILTNAQMVLTGYHPGTLNYGVSATVPLSNFPVGGPTNVIWGSISTYAPGN